MHEGVAMTAGTIAGTGCAAPVKQLPESFGKRVSVLD
jgi:hypothetical protein